MASFELRGPADLRALNLEQLEIVAEDVRQEIISACLRNGGHLGASLGTVELAIALHHVFESPREPLVWDVGHQAYAHKLLTGRWEKFGTLRRKDGISGFLAREESEHDVFGAGHAGTALSAALAMAWSRGQRPETRTDWTVAVVGDGALTCGLSFEALNNVTGSVRDGECGPFLVVLNDNQMSISPNVSAVPDFGRFGFDTVGPVDGHDLGILLGTLRGIRGNYSGRPVLLHVMTQKGRGYAPAEERPAYFHGIGPIQPKIEAGPDKATAVARARTYSEAFGDAICRLAEEDQRIVAITAAMTEGTGLAGFARKFPKRFFDVGIAEGHAVTFAAGLATQGYRPVVAIYSTFLQRAMDSLIHDVALQKLGVTFALDRAGLVGADGATHHGAFDLSYLGMIPGMKVSAPACLADLERLLRLAVASGTPWALRFPRGNGTEDFGEGDVRWLRKPEGMKICAVALGASVQRALEAVKAVDPTGLRVGLVSAVHCKPISDSLVRELRALDQVPLLTVEDGIASGGFGWRLREELGDRGAPILVSSYGDRFIPHGTPSETESMAGVAAGDLRSALEALLG